MSKKILNKIANVFKNKKENTESYVEIKTLPTLENYPDYLKFLNEDEQYIKLVIFTKEDCNDCIKGLEIVSQLLDKYSDKLKVLEIKLFKDSSKNILCSRLLDQYDINFVPNYVLLYKDNFEKISNKNFQYIDSRLSSYLK